MTEHFLVRNGRYIALRCWMPLAMAIPGWVSFCILQWFCIRATYTITDDGRCQWTGLRLAWPLTGWHWSPRIEIYIPIALTIALWSAVAWWLL